MIKIGYFLRVMISSFEREFKLFIRYPYWLLVSLISPFLWVTLFMLFGSAFASTGDFVGFITIGMIGLMIADISLWGVGLGLRREQMRGTIVSLYSTPANKIAILLGVALESFIELTFVSTIIVTYASLAFNFTAYIADPLAVLLVLMASIFSLIGFGLLFAAITMVVKEPNAIINLVQPVLFIFSGIFFPIDVLPEGAKIISKMIPLTYVMESMRKVFVYGATLSSVSWELIIIVSFGLILNSIGVIAIKAIEKKMLKTGDLGKF